MVAMKVSKRQFEVFIAFAEFLYVFDGHSFK